MLRPVRAAQERPPFTAGVGAALAQLGSKVLLIDGDCGLRNLDIVLGMSDRVVYSFADVARRRGSPCGCHGVSSGYENAVLTPAPVALPALSERGMEQLAVQAEEAGFDYLLIDGPAGLPAELSFLAHIATQAIIVTSTDRVVSAARNAAPASWREEYCIQRIRMVLNRVRPQLISHGKSGNIDDAMDEAGLPCSVLCRGCGPHFVQQQRQEHSCRQTHGRGSRLCEYRPAAQRRAYSNLNCKKSRNKYTGKGLFLMNIALIAHDRKKELMVQFCMAYCGILAKHNICATGTTGKFVEEATGLKIDKVPCGYAGRRGADFCTRSLQRDRPRAVFP